ncbi:MAG: ABC transporter substrate-binding protein [Geopsychrobacter sp.]|nr:ABC transporter substrate-binding protein [Geopsychrobacter sp.]
MRLVMFLILILICVLGGPSSAWAAPVELSPRLEKVSLQLKWKHQFQFAGYYAALEQGYYREVGLDVDIRARGLDTLRSVDQVLKGVATYGVEGANLLVRRLRGAPLVALAAIFQHSPMVTLALQKNHINTVKDMVGKRMMDNGVAEVGLPAMLLQEGIDPQRSITRLPMSYSLESLINGETDLYSAYLTNETYFLKQRKIPYTVINPVDYGIDFYSDILFTTEKELAEHPRRVRDFLSASLKGWRYALDHPIEIVDLILRCYAPSKSRDHLLFEAQETATLVRSGDVEIGHINPRRFKQMADVLQRLKRVEMSERLAGFVYAERLAGQFSAAELDWLAQHKMIRVRIANVPPLLFTEKGQPRGIAVDYLQRIAQETGLEFEYVDQPQSWDEALRALMQHQKLDLLPAITPTPERRARIALTDSYLQMPSVIFTRKSAPSIRSLDGLSGLKVGVVKGYKVHGLLEKSFLNFELLPVATVQDAVRGLAAGEIDAYVGNLITSAYVIRQQGLGQIVVAAPVPFEGADMAMGVRSDWPELASIINRVLRNISFEDQRKIRAKWYDINFEAGVPMRKITEWGLGILLVLVFGFVLFSLWNMRLKREIERRKITEKALRESESLYRSTFENIQAGVTHLSADGRILQVNRYMCRMLGYSKDELCALSLAQITHTEDLQISNEMLQQLYKDKGRGSYSLAKRYLRKDGSAVWGLISVSLLPQAEDAGCFVVIVQDIDEFKHQQDDVTEAARNLEQTIGQRTEELRCRVVEVEKLNRAMQNLTEDLRISNQQYEKKSREASKSNQEMEFFAYSVSHDLCAPLRHISSFAAILQERSSAQLDESAQGHLNKIAVAAQKIGQMIDDLLSFSRVGRVELLMASVDMNLLFQEVRNEIDFDYTAPAIHWKFSDLPQITGDVRALRQVVFNLLDNAAKYSSKKAQPCIEVSAQQDADEIVFYVRDNGVGFDPTYADKLFKVFQRLHRDEEFTGVGIGLASVRRILARHDGWVKAESEAGQGACFSFGLRQVDRGRPQQGVT